MSVAEARGVLRLDSLERSRTVSGLHIQPCAAKHGEGLHAGLDWLSLAVKERRSALGGKTGTDTRLPYEGGVAKAATAATTTVGAAEFTVKTKAQTKAQSTTATAMLKQTEKEKTAPSMMYSVLSKVAELA